MKRREQIIVVIAVVAGLYGLIDYFVLSGQGTTGKDDTITSGLSGITAFADTVRGDLGHAARSRQEFPDVDYLIAKAESPWPADPFITYDPDQLEQDSAAAEEILPQLAYTGFIQAGSKALAIINGMEYLSGEMLKETGYTVHHITASQVVLKTDTRREIILQLEEN